MSNFAIAGRMAATVATVLAMTMVAQVAKADHGRGFHGYANGQQIGGNNHPRQTPSHYQDHRLGGAASSGTHIRCILPFCGHSFTPHGVSHYQDHRNDAPHYQDHRGNPPRGGTYTIDGRSGGRR